MDVVRRLWPLLRAAAALLVAVAVITAYLVGVMLLILLVLSGL